MNAYRDDHDAALARIHSLEHELEAKDAELVELRNKDSEANRFYDSFYQNELQQSEEENERVKAENRKLHEELIDLKARFVPFPKDEIDQRIKELQRQVRGDVNALLATRIKYIAWMIVAIGGWALARLLFEVR